MTYLRTLLGRVHGLGLSLLVHGGLAAVACVSLVHVSGGSRGGGEAGTGNGIPMAGFSAGFHSEPERLDGEIPRDPAQFGTVTDREPEPVDLARPPIPFDAFARELSEETLPLAESGLPPEPLLGRTPSDIRGARLPRGVAQPEDSGGTGALQGPVGTGSGSGTGRGTGEGSGDATEAVLVYAPQSYEYPREARRQSIEGEVVVEITIREDGSCAVNRILQSSGSSIFDQAIHQMIASWKYKPAMAAGRPIATLDRVRFRFQLTK